MIFTIIVLNELIFKAGFPGGPVVKISPFSAGGTGSFPDSGAKISHASCQKAKRQNRSNIVTNSIDLKCPHQGKTPHWAMALLMWYRSHLSAPLHPSNHFILFYFYLFGSTGDLSSPTRYQTSALQGGFLTTGPQGKSQWFLWSAALGHLPSLCWTLCWVYCISIYPNPG